MGELSCEHFDNAIHPLTHGVEYVKNGELFNSRATLPELYLCGDLVLHCHFGNSGCELGEHRAIFKRLSVKNTMSLDMSGALDLAELHAGLHTNSDNYMQSTMFVGVVHLMEKPKRIFGTTIRSVIRLTPLDHCPMYRLQTLQIPLDRGSEAGLLDGSFVIEDRKLGGSVGPRRPQKCKLPSKTVKRRPEIVADLADANSTTGIKRCADARPDYRLSRIRMKLWNNSVVVDTGMMIHVGLEYVSLVLSSPDLEARAIERMHQLYSSYGKEAEADPNDAREPGHPCRQAEVTDRSLKK